MGLKPLHRKCLGCKELFTADRRNTHHQAYCCKTDCRRASKAASQRRWLARAANRDYFRGAENVRRVQRWRKEHPGYWKRKAKAEKPSEPAAGQAVTPSRDLVTHPPEKSLPLQDVCMVEHPAFIGLVAMITGRTLQEDIAATARRIEARGRDILGRVSPGPTPNNNHYDCQTPASSGSSLPTKSQSRRLPFFSGSML